MSFDADQVHCLVADVNGELQAFAVHGKTDRLAGRAVLSDGRILCPLHGWPIDPEDGRCGAGQACHYERLSVEVVGDEIWIGLPCP